ncbi:MAG: CoxG family protein [Alkalilacustris sp.]
MDLHDDLLIPAPRDRVYAALNDLDVLRAAIPGCEALTEEPDGALAAVVLLKVGPVKARFRGRVTLDRSAAPEGFTLAGEGQGGPAGFARGGAEVRLEDRGDETLLRYDARAEIGGKLAQLGSRLIQGTARKLATRFFESLSEQVTDSERQPG